jgi:hypothetical protein
MEMNTPHGKVARRLRLSRVFIRHFALLKIVAETPPVIECRLWKLGCKGRAQIFFHRAVSFHPFSIVVVT